MLQKRMTFDRESYLFL